MNVHIYPFFFVYIINYFKLKYFELMNRFKYFKAANNKCTMIFNGPFALLELGATAIKKPIIISNKLRQSKIKKIFPIKILFE